MSSSTQGDILLASLTEPGRAQAVAVDLVTAEEHWREIGHCTEAFGARTVTTNYIFTDEGDPPLALLETPEADWTVMPIGTPGEFYEWHIDSTFSLTLDEYVEDVERFTVIFYVNAGTLTGDWIPYNLDYINANFRGQITEPPPSEDVVTGDCALGGSRAIVGGTLGADDWHFEIERIPGTDTSWRYRASYDGGSTWGSWTDLSTGTLSDELNKCSLEFTLTGYVQIESTAGVQSAPTWKPDGTLEVTAITVTGEYEEVIPDEDYEDKGLAWAIVHFN